MIYLSYMYIYVKKIWNCIDLYFVLYLNSAIEVLEVGELVQMNVLNLFGCLMLPKSFTKSSALGKYHTCFSLSPFYRVSHDALSCVMLS